MVVLHIYLKLDAWRRQAFINTVAANPDRFSTKGAQEKLRIQISRTSMERMEPGLTRLVYSFKQPFTFRQSTRAYFNKRKRAAAGLPPILRHAHHFPDLHTFFVLEANIQGRVS